MTSTPHAFRLYPAIDLIDGRAVRLLHGQFDQLLTNELDDARARAELVWAAGASALHVIDLDAARTGAPAEPNVSVLAALAAGKPAGAILQVGGGLRSAAAVEALLAQGVDRVLIGTMALRDPATLRGLVERHGSKIAVALDSRQGTVRVSGWVEDAGIRVDDAASGGRSPTPIENAGPPPGGRESRAWYSPARRRMFSAAASSTARASGPRKRS